MSLPDDIRQRLRQEIERRDPSRCIQFVPADCPAEWNEYGVTTKLLDEQLDVGRELSQRSQPTQLAIVVNAPSVLPRRSTEQLLGRLRNYGTGTIIAAFSIAEASRHDTWSASDFLGLGFRRLRHTTSTQSDYWLYRYAIHDYKITPDWLNSRHWANPEQWDKHRW